MGSESIFERNNTIKAMVNFKDASSVLTDPSGSKAFIRVIKSDGTNLIGASSGATASRTATGTFEYYFNTSSTDPLGLYIILWKGMHNIGSVDGIDYGYKDILQRNCIRIVDTQQD